MFETITIEREDPFLFITLNRPRVRNAINQQMTLELLRVFTDLRQNRDVRAIVISGAGGTFCTGGDLKEMQATYAHPQSDKHSTQFDDLLHAINTAPQVVIAQVEGAAIGGGLGLVCVSDIAIAASDTIFALPEVRLGIIPAMIMPYVVQRIGLTNARRLMLTGARFEGVEATNYGIVHQVCDPAELAETIDIVLADVRECSPEAIATGKQLLLDTLDPTADTSPARRAALLDELRQSADGQEGMLAFIQKRKPLWAHHT